MKKRLLWRGPKADTAHHPAKKKQAQKLTEEARKSISTHKQTRGNTYTQSPKRAGTHADTKHTHAHTL